MNSTSMLTHIDTVMRNSTSNNNNYSFVIDTPLDHDSKPDLITYQTLIQKMKIEGKSYNAIQEVVQRATKQLMKSSVRTQNKGTQFSHYDLSNSISSLFNLKKNYSVHLHIPSIF